jgi:protein SCO1
MKAFLLLLLFSLTLALGSGAIAPSSASAEVARHGGTPEPVTTVEAAPAGVNAAAVSGDVSADAPIDVVQMREIRFEPQLNAQVPLDLGFKDEAGRSVKLGDYLGQQPLLLSINDFTCQDLCPLELQNLVDAMDQVTLKLGTDYKALAVSLNPANTAQDATTMRDDIVHRYKRPDAPNGADGWHFLTGDDTSIHLLTQAVGLHYAYDAASKDYAHPVGVIVLTPEGKIARYLYGMDFPPNDLRLAIYEASQGKISDPITPILLLCYHYDIATGRYTNVALTLVRTGGVLTVLGLGTFIGVMLRRETRGGKEARAQANSSPGAPAGTGSQAKDGEE